MSQIFVRIIGTSLDSESSDDLKTIIQSELDKVTYDETNTNCFDCLNELDDDYIIGCYAYFDSLTEANKFINAMYDWLIDYDFDHYEDCLMDKNVNSTQWSDEPKPDVMTEVFSYGFE